MGKKNNYKGERTRIMACSCKHSTQDELYKGKRLFNMMSVPYAVGEAEHRVLVANYRCTVCGNEVNGIKI